MKYLLVGVYQVCSNKSSGVKIAFSLYVYSKNLKIFFQKSQRASAKILSMKHLLMGVYQVCSKNGPWVNIGPAPGVINFPYMCIVKIF
jgi:hypothetical protein